MKSLLENSKYPLSHSGVAHDENPPGRGSGRYPWGSGKRPMQRVNWGGEVVNKIGPERLEKAKQTALKTTKILAKTMLKVGAIAITPKVGAFAAAQVLKIPAVRSVLQKTIVSLTPAVMRFAKNILGYQTLKGLPINEVTIPIITNQVSKATSNISFWQELYDAYMGVSKKMWPRIGN